MKNKIYILGTGVALLLGIAIFAGFGTSSFGTIKDFSGEIKIYKSQSCGCCGIYGSYFQNKGSSNTKVVNLQDLDQLKEEYRVPSAMQSCHTTVIGDYFVEGHVPLEAVEKLLKEKPNIKGIAMPGMPEGSPGMPGPKREEFIIYSINYDNSYEEFMRV